MKAQVVYNATEYIHTSLNHFPHGYPFLIGEGVHSRTTEVLQCINILEDRGQSTAISFLIHSFEEVISLFISM